MTHRTLAGLERELRRLLKTRKVRVEYHSLGKRKVDGFRTVGELESTDDCITIRCDLHTAAPLEVVVHELVHELLWDDLKSWGELGEIFVLGLEESVVRHILKNAKLLAWWRDAIRTRVRPPRSED